MALQEQALTRANLSYDDVSRWSGFTSPVMVNDYLGIGEATNLIFAAVDQNSEDIESNRDSITANAEAIELNREDIDLNATNLAAHILDESAHGVTGVVVGTEDFCTDLIGGVVLLMETVSDAVASTAEVTIIDVPNAELSYSDAYANQQTDLINDVKAKHNALLADLNLAIIQFNDLIAKSKIAKQMAT